MSLKRFLICRAILKIAIPLLLMLGVTGLAQTPKNDVFRKKIDSLNRVAFDDPAAVTKTADAMLLVAKQKKRTADYALLLQVKGVAETSMGNNAEALRFHMQSYHIFDSIGNRKGKIFGLVNIAAVHLNMDNPEKAQDYLLNALAIIDTKDYNNRKTVYVNLGVCQDYLGNHQKAIGYFSQSVPYMEKLQDYNGLAVTYHNIAGSYTTLEDYKQAENSELKALENQKKTGSKSSLAMIATSLAHLYIIGGNLKKAKAYLDDAAQVVYQLDSPYDKEAFYETMSDWYKASHDYKNSGIYLEKLLALRDTINSEEKTQITAEIEGKFQNNLKTKEIELLRVQKKLDASKIERNRFWRVVFLVISVLSIGLIFILYRNYKLKQKANLLLSQEKTELKAQNLQLENENILVQFETLKNQVSPHFLFNSLNALASLIPTNPEKAVAFTTAFSKIFRNALELKDRHLVTLAEELQHVNAYLSLQKMRFGSNLVFNISVPSEKMNDYLPPFSLQMVIENAVKHNVITTEEPLTIDIRVDGDFLVVANKLQQRKFVEDSTGTGIANIKSRYKYVTALEPVFEIRNQEYIAKLPLITEE